MKSDCYLRRCLDRVGLTRKEFQSDTLPGDRCCPNLSRSAGFQPAQEPPRWRRYAQIRTVPGDHGTGLPLGVSGTLQFSQGDSGPGTPRKPMAWDPPTVPDLHVSGP